MTVTVIEALAARVAALASDSLPADVVRMARRCLLDTLGCVLQGFTTTEARPLAAAAHDLGPAGSCHLWGTSRTAPPAVAAPA